MDLIPDPHTSPAEWTVETVRAWQLELSEVERRIGVHSSRWDVLATRHTLVEHPLCFDRP